jgi:hypothetical protein
MSANGRLRFKIRRGAFEVELEGEFDYVMDQFEELMAKYWQPSSMAEEEETPDTPGGTDLKGVLETGADGKPHFVIPFDSLTAREAIGLVLFHAQPTALGDKELSDALNRIWKPTKPGAIRARASELHKDGKLVTEKGRYVLSGAGLQWVRGEVIPSLRRARSPGSRV